MMMDVFEQFKSPEIMRIPLMMLAIALPSMVLSSEEPGIYKSRIMTLKGWVLFKYVSEVLKPLKQAAQNWAVLFTALIIFLITLNLTGNLPYTFAPTAQLSLSLGLAFPLWLATVILGFWKMPSNAFSHLLPDSTPVPLVPALVVIESVSLLSRPLSLAVRLAANLTAGHIIMHMLTTGTLHLLFIFSTMEIPTMITLYTFIILEFMVALIQGYVFVLLLSLYLKDNS